MHVQRFILPYPPSVNALYMPVNGAQILSPVGRAYKEGVARMLEGRTSEPRLGLIRVEADVFRPRKAGDLSNLIKVLEDVLTGRAYRDDEQTVSLRFERWEDPEFPRVQLTVTELDEEDREPPRRWRISDPALRMRFGLAVAGVEAVKDAARLKRNAPAAAEALFTKSKPAALVGPDGKPETTKERLTRLASSSYRPAR